MAYARQEDARVLLRGARTQGAAYMAGYAVECMMKAATIERTPPMGRGAIIASFRGQSAHNLEQLKRRCRDLGIVLSSRLARHFSAVATWSVLLRYESGARRYNDAEAFLGSVDAVVQALDGQL